MVDARLPDGSRVNAIIPPLALDGALLSIRRFGARPFVIKDLLTRQALVPEMELLADQTEDVFVSFNNNNRDYPVRNALRLKRLLGQRVPEDALPGDLFA